MAKSISLALYLAAQARRDRALRRGGNGKTLTDKEELRAAERLGTYVKSRPKGPLIWFHTGQDAPAIAIRNFARRLQSERDDLQILLTTSADNRLNSVPCLTSQFAPDETLSAIRRFLDHWKPDISVWSEPDPRPALIAETSRHKVPLVLVDTGTARPEPQSWRWWRGMSGNVLSGFQHVLASDAEAATVFRKLGAGPGTVEISGRLEEGPAALSCNETERAAMARAIGGRPVWLAAHITRTERNAVVAAHIRAQRRAHRLLLIIVPEDPAVGLDWAREVAQEKQTVARQSAGQNPDGQTQIYIADSDPEMGLWYRLAPISFLGQSLEPKGGVNPYEAAALGSAILHGPHIDAYAQTYARLASARATRLVRIAAELGDGVEALLSPDIAASLAHGAWQVCSTGATVTDRVMDLILTTLDARETI